MDAIILMIVAYLTITSMLMLIKASSKNYYMVVIAFSIMSIFIISPILLKYNGCYILVIINIIFIWYGIANYIKVTAEEFVTYTLDKDDYKVVSDADGLVRNKMLDNKEHTLIKWRGMCLLHNHY